MSEHTFVPRRHGKTMQIWRDLIEEAYKAQRMIMIGTDTHIPELAQQLIDAAGITVDRHPYMPEGVMMLTTRGFIEDGPPLPKYDPS